MCGFVGLVIKWDMDLKVSTTIVRLAYTQPDSAGKRAIASVKEIEWGGIGFPVYCW